MIKEGRRRKGTKNVFHRQNSHFGMDDKHPMHLAPCGMNFLAITLCFALLKMCILFVVWPRGIFATVVKGKRWDEG